MKKIRYHLFALLAAYFSAVPLLLLVLKVTPLTGVEVYLLLLNTIGWAILCAFLIRIQQTTREVATILKMMGLPNEGKAILDVLQDISSESEKRQRALFQFEYDQITAEREQGVRAAYIVSLARNMLNARCVELSLFDSNSGQWSQALMLGEPSTVQVQSLLLEAQEPGSGGQVPTGIMNNVVVKPLIFAGRLFGLLRVEFSQERNLGRREEELVFLLATQAALLLIDARFSDELLRMRRVSEESVRAKTGFLANLSHEIRGPLGIILNGVELNLEGICGPLTTQQKETLSMMKDSGEHLLDLVNDVLDYAKVEAGKVVAKPVDIAVGPMLKDLVSVIRTQAQSKKHKVVLAPCEANLGLSCDKRHARQILINFLTNAVKYTPEGGTITVSAERLPNRKVKIAVCDSGVGIPDSEREKVFGAFERVNNKYSMAQMGTGLGMPLALKLAEVNGGIVDFESEEGKGSTFWLILNGVELASADEVKDARNEELPLVEGNNHHVLVVDHEEESRSLLQRYLVDRGFSVFTASTSDDVFRHLRESGIQLAIIDNDLPDCPGDELITTIRSGVKFASLPIVLLSSKAFVFDIERFLKLGVDRCLSKPVELREVALTTRRLIDETLSTESLVGPTLQ